MIELFTGKPGAGKTYLAVKRLLELPKGQYVVFHNIDGLRPEAFSEPDMIRQIPADEMTRFITRERQEEYAAAIREKYDRAMLIVIDEAQMWFGERNDTRKSWLSWHRHLGQDIILIAQHYRMLHSDYNVLCEYEIRALKSSLLNRLLVYQYRVSGEAFKTKTERKNKKVFEAYRSFQGQEVSKPEFKFVYYLIGGVVVAICFFILLKGFWSSGKAQAATEPSKPGILQSAMKKTTETDKKIEQPKDPWKESKYRGVMGPRVIVDYQGRLCELSEVVGVPYSILDAGRIRCTVITKTGHKVLERGSREPTNSNASNDNRSR